MSSDAERSKSPSPRHSIRWWPAAGILVLAAVSLAVVRSDAMRAALLRDRPHLTVDLFSAVIGLITAALLLIWWVLLSRARWPWRLAGIALAGAFLACFRHSGMSGDLVPTFELRWARRPPPTPTPSGKPAVSPPTVAVRPDFPQFLGPDRNGTLPAAGLATNWATTPPVVLWRRPLGTGWSGFAIVGSRALTQEQVDDQELVTCYAVETGEPLWRHSYPGRFVSPIAGDGPRATPTVVSNRVFTLGSLGQLSCLELETGQPLWSRALTNDASTHVPDWGFCGSPLVTDGLVVINAGGSPGKSLLAYHADTGQPAWSAGDDGVNYGSPGLFTLAGTRQIVLFNHRSITGHDPGTGRVLWRQPWGSHYPMVAMPVAVGTNRFLVSAGYNVGAALFEVQRGADGAFTLTSRWESKRLKAKFANPYVRDGFVYGLDDGILTCLDLKDGTQRWKEGRYGHGQGLLVGDVFLLMAESGELVLLQPTPDGPNELGRFRVFSDKTWNPIALSGDLLLARNDREAALLRLPRTR